MELDQDHARDGGIFDETTKKWEWFDDQMRWHRVDGPARIYLSGRQEWWYHGLRHREVGPALICSDGSQTWYQHGQWHRVDGPAWIGADGYQAWWFHGQRHRANGPAAIDDKGLRGWYIHGHNITTEVNTWMRKHNITWPFTAEQRAEFALRWL